MRIVQQRRFEKANKINNVPDEDGSFQHPVSVFGRDGAHENLLFKKPIAYIRAFRHLDDKRVLLAAALLDRRVLKNPDGSVERAHDLTIVFIHEHESPTEVLVSTSTRSRTRTRHWGCSCCSCCCPCRRRQGGGLLFTINADI